MKNKILLASLLLALGCAQNTPLDGSDSAVNDNDAAPDSSSPKSCPVGPSDVVGYQDCGGTKKDGYRCFTTCGIVDFSPDASGSPLLTNCLVGQAETSLPAICVTSCSSCN